VEVDPGLGEFLLGLGAAKTSGGLGVDGESHFQSSVSYHSELGSTG
jgi:hypothetical protein